MPVFHILKPTQYIPDMHIRCLYNSQFGIRLYAKKLIEQRIAPVKITRMESCKIFPCTLWICITQTIGVQQMRVELLHATPST